MARRVKTLNMMAVYTTVPWLRNHTCLLLTISFDWINTSDI